MKRLFLLAPLVVIAGCSSFSATRDAWTFSPSEALPAPKITLSDSEVADLKQRQAQLQARYAETRTQLAQGASPRARVPTYMKLDDIGVPLAQTERRLWQGGRLGE